jgi:hypothetical protein
MPPRGCVQRSRQVGRRILTPSPWKKPFATRNPCVKVGTLGPIRLPKGAAHAAAEGGRRLQMGEKGRGVNCY